MRAEILVKKLLDLRYRSASTLDSKWQFQASDLSWKDYPLHESNQIEFQFQHDSPGIMKKKVGTAQIYLGDVMEEYGDGEFYQIRNGARRNIRRIGPTYFATWQFKRSDGTWQSYTIRETRQIEDMYHQPRPESKRIGSFEIHMPRTDDGRFYQTRGGRERDIRRIVKNCTPETACDPDEPIVDCIPANACDSSRQRSKRPRTDDVQSTDETIVVALPCGGGFPHRSTVERLISRGIAVHTFFASDYRGPIFGSLAHKASDVPREAAKLVRDLSGTNIVLHGWSRGGAYALDIAEGEPPVENIIGMALFAAARKVRDPRNINYPVILYHNDRDTMVPVGMSEQSARMISGATLDIDKTYNDRGNNHQCEEFSEKCADWIRSLVSTQKAAKLGSQPIRGSANHFADYMIEACKEYNETNKFANLKSYYHPSDPFPTQFLNQSPTHRFRTPTPWLNLRCVESKINDFVVKVRCSKSSGASYSPNEEGGYKIFVQSYKGQSLTNLADYFRLMKRGIIADAHHRELCEAVEALRHKAETTIQRKVGIINENVDVDWLHFRMRVLR